MAHDAGVCTLGADRVQEGQKYTLLHELVNLGDSLVKCGWVRWYVGLRQSQQVVTNLSREVDL